MLRCTWNESENGMTTMENLYLASRLLKLEEQFLAEVTCTCNSLEAKVHTLSDALDIAKTERDELADRVSKIESQKVVTKQHGQLYLESVRQCCIELLSCWHEEHRASNQVCTATYGTYGG